ncbi:chromosomal replication initiator protein DnaA [Candidatus Parcubacteria bacterium]|nr:chromosomal replication initiator protein DnaA [Patescibacteria group bacterium]MCG2693960.1 chromosomal replication initiator protein DnaA [Candidatus Parcubacteria bacterium]
MNNDELWQSALGELELTLSKANFTTWFKNTSISSFEKNNIIIAVPNAFTKSWLEQKYNEEIKKTLQKLTGQPLLGLIYKVEPRYSLNTNIVIIKDSQINPSDTVVPEQKRDRLNKFGLNPKYIFDTFIVGKSNELAHAACQAVAARPGKAYNPLFLYGGVGLGKTHLLHAVGHELLKKNPETKILYLTCERFVTEYTNAIRLKKMKEFKDKYRGVDLLLVDDIQILTGKEGTQEEFFHTYNELHQSDRQIIVTCDKAPKEIPGLEERLRSRLEWGMVADISFPDLETRVAILQSKCQEKKYNMDRRILQYIAANIQSNIRELEGVLTKIIAYHQLRNAAPSFETIKNIVSGFAPNKTKKNITTKHLINTICDFYNLDTDELFGKTREQRVAWPRQVLMYLMREELNFSFPTIGKEVGGKDHTTVMHACSKIKKAMEGNVQLKQDLETLKQNVYNSPIL